MVWTQGAMVPMNRRIVLDTETTGLSFADDRIVEIGGVEIVDLIPTGRTFHTYVCPGIPVPLDAVDVHGLTTEFLADKPLFPQIAEDFLAFVGDAGIIAHNAAFDIGMLNAELKRSARKSLFNEVIDSLEIARRKHPLGPNSLDALCKRYGVDTTKRMKHGALLDAELLAKVYADLVGRQAKISFVETVVDGANVFAVTQRPSPLRPRLTQADLSAHNAMLGEIPNARWSQLITGR